MRLGVHNIALLAASLLKMPLFINEPLDTFVQVSGGQWPLAWDVIPDLGALGWRWQGPKPNHMGYGGKDGKCTDYPVSGWVIHLV